VSDPAPRAPLSLLGCGCAVIVALIVAGIVTLTWIGYRSGERYRAELADPAAREARVAALLPHAALPPGTYAVGGLSVPFLMDMAVLADREPGPLRGGGADDPGVRSGFVFVRTRDAWGRRHRLQALFEAENPDPAAFAQGEVGFVPKEEIGRGELEAGGATVHYYARRGELAVDQTRFGVELPEGAEPVRRFEGVATMMLIDCPGEGRYLRVGLWFGPEWDRERPTDAPEPGGTAGSPAALQAFFEPLKLCA
jgi:hypothetical protein